MKGLRIAGLLACAVPVLLPRDLWAGMSPMIEFTARVTQFNERVVRVRFKTREWTIPRAWVPESVDLKPGLLLQLERPLEDFDRMEPVPPKRR